MYIAIFMLFSLQYMMFCIEFYHMQNTSNIWLEVWPHAKVRYRTETLKHFVPLCDAQLPTERLFTVSTSLKLAAYITFVKPKRRSGVWLDAQYVFTLGKSQLRRGISNPNILILPMDYKSGVLNSMSSTFFPELRKDLGPFLVDKTMLIKNIVIDNRLTGHVDLVLRPRRCGKSTMLQMLK